MAAVAWLGGLWRGDVYGDAAQFLSLAEYEHVGRWVREIDARPASRRGMLVNTAKGLAERHSADDFSTLDPALLAAR